jgi:hypothetical protein
MEQLSQGFGSSSMHWKFNFDNLDFLNFENMSSSSKLGISFGSSVAMG